MKSLFGIFGLLFGYMFVILLLSIMVVTVVRAEQIIYPQYNLPGTLGYSLQQQANIQAQQLELQKEQMQRERFNEIMQDEPIEYAPIKQKSSTVNPILDNNIFGND
jgi:hypothetical protein